MVVSVGLDIIRQVACLDNFFDCQAGVGTVCPFPFCIHESLKREVIQDGLFHFGVSCGYGVVPRCPEKSTRRNRSRHKGEQAS